jgi:cytochrome c553
MGEVLLANVYEGLEGAAPGSVRELRIVQIFPKSTPIANQPPIGIAGEENARAILGTVPVEADGSASFLLPAGKPVLFQALDADGVALRTMRSVAYVHAGEKVSCVGCHERPTLSPPARGARELAALRRPPSTIEAGSLGGRPFSYVEVVQPILDRRCTSCHGGEKPAAALDLTGEAHGDYSRSYVSLCVEADARGREAGGGPGENAKGPFVARFAARDQLQITPALGPHGTRGSRLFRMLREGHGKVELDQEELRRLAAWIDLNAIFFGSNLPEDQARQRRGETLPMPAIQ